MHESRDLFFFGFSVGIRFRFDSFRSLSRSVSRAPTKQNFRFIVQLILLCLKSIFFVCLNKFMCVVQFVTLPTATATKKPTVQTLSILFDIGYNIFHFFSFTRRSLIPFVRSFIYFVRENFGAIFPDIFFRLSLAFSLRSDLRCSICCHCY